MDLTSAPWRKSSYSSNGGATCVEVAVWRKSSFSSNGGADCVEVAADSTPAIAVRDSKDPDGPRLVLTPAAWTSFTRRIKAGQHDLP
ncbi:MAG TPA: DUF397 domain-containing protein [Streptosporangiaceae bacterium]|jgi:hypothetical protein